MTELNGAPVNLIVVSLIYDKRAIPIYFEVLPQLGSTSVLQQIAVLSQVLPLLKNYKKVVLGDREFCAVDLAQWLKSQPQTYFCLRLKRNEYIEIAPDIWWQLQSLGINPGLSIYLEGVKLTKSKGFSQANIAAKWKRNYRDCSAKEAWFILTSLSDLKMALSAYQKRFWNEKMFKNYKNGDYNLESTSITVNRLIALIILMTLAYTSSIMCGQKIKDKGVVKYVGRVKEKRRTQRRHSSFYIGVHGYDWVESLELLAEQTVQLMSLSPHKRSYYQRGNRAEKLIQSTFGL